MESCRGASRRALARASQAASSREPPSLEDDTLVGDSRKQENQRGNFKENQTGGEWVGFRQKALNPTYAEDAYF